MVMGFLIAWLALGSWTFGGGARSSLASGDPRQGEARWTFAVISDLHVPRDGRIPPRLSAVIRAVIASRPRFVVVTGDFTDGNPSDAPRTSGEAPLWWRSARAAVEPLRAAGIAVLPVAGNHDSYLPVYRTDYAHAWRDLDRWAEPLPILGKRQPARGIALDGAPFTYATEVDGVHLTLAHVVDDWVEPAVASRIAEDLAHARGARLRFVFGHVPLASVVEEPRRDFVESFGRVLASGHADFYVAGHEHLVWDEDVFLPGGSSVRQVVVATASAPWRFGPSAAARARAGCAQRDLLMRCRMPNEGVPFELRLERGHWLETQPHAFTLFTIEGTSVLVRAYAVDEHGAVTPFGVAHVE
ncbi:MAG TPA: metallophosphoesterase [Polyangiaceae bacterium]|nr:metallophosphoesterase [Polyangiaceae bacterium]